MTWIDAVIVIVFLYFIITAFNAGFIREIIGMASAVAGAVLAGLFYKDVASSLLSSIDNEATANVVGFLVIFLAVTVAGQILATLLHPAVTILQLGIFDQFLGAVLGAAKAYVILEVLLILFATYPRYDMDKRIDDSQFAGILLDTGAPVLKVLPDVFHSCLEGDWNRTRARCPL